MKLLRVNYTIPTHSFPNKVFSAFFRTTTIPSLVPALSDNVIVSTATEEHEVDMSDGFHYFDENGQLRNMPIMPPEPVNDADYEWHQRWKAADERDDLDTLQAMAGADK